MVRAVFAGSFDPPTYGHLNVIERAKNIFSDIHVVIAVNKQKNTLFTAEERFSMMKKLVSQWSSVSVHLCDTLVADYAKENNANVLIRGVRNITDFSYEFDLSICNKSLSSNLETVFLPTDPKFFVLRSSAIKELASFGGDVSGMVPPLVADALKNKFDKNLHN